MKEKRQYTQNWKAYDKAKTNEDFLFKRLLEELVFFAVDEDTIKLGRTGYSTKEKILILCMKAFYNSNLRKTQSILKENKNGIMKIPSYKTISNFYSDSRLNKILDELIIISAIPVALLEETGAIDSTGFSTSRFARWHKYKWGKKTGKEQKWVKLHACTGCKTNIFLSVRITKKNVNDTKMFEEVIGNSTRYFNMNDFVGDKAYSSKKNLEFINKLGLNPYIPFKKNVTGKARGSPVWRQVYLEFINNHENYMKHYHKRSNVETNFAMLKKRFGDNCTTHSIKNQEVELKIKVLCHNICVLIQETFENDIEIDFDDCVKITKSV